MNNHECGGEPVVENAFGGGKFVCCSDCDFQTKAYPDHEEHKAVDDWNDGKFEPVDK